MDRAQSQYLRIFSGSFTYQRWQSYYVAENVTWEGQTWFYQPFDTEGISVGPVESEGSIRINFPASRVVMEAVLAALQQSRLVELRMYEFDAIIGGGPQASQSLVASYLGELVAAQATLTTIEIEIGSSLSPIGVQVPLRTFTTELVGSPCKL